MQNDLTCWLEEAGVKLLKHIGIKEKQKILDFGCGQGNYAIPAARVVGKDGVVYALDKDKRSLDKLMLKAKEIGLSNIIRLNTTKTSEIKLDNECLDAVLLYDVFHYYYYPQAEDRRQLLLEIYRVLKKNALLSFYPTHLESYMKPRLEEVEREIREANFDLESEYPNLTMIHDDNLEKGHILNYRKRIQHLK